MRIQGTHVANTAVDVAFLLEAKEPRTMSGVVENVALSRNDLLAYYVPWEVYTIVSLFFFFSFFSIRRMSSRDREPEGSCLPWWRRWGQLGH
jgi:hypothetical protein